MVGQLEYKTCNKIRVNLDSHASLRSDQLRLGKLLVLGLIAWTSLIF